MTEDTLNQQITLSLQRVESLWQKTQEWLKLPGDTALLWEDGSTQQKNQFMESLAELSYSLQELQFAAGELHQQNQRLSENLVAIEAERQHYQDLFTSAPAGYLVTDPDGIIIEANQVAAQLLHFSPDRLVGKSVIVFVATPERQDFFHTLSLLQQGESIHHWLVQMQPRGGYAWLASVTVVPVHSSQGQVEGLRWQLQDTSRGNPQEVTQRTNQHLFCSLVEKSTLGIAVLESQGGVIHSNPTLQRMLGCDEQALQRIFPQLLNLDKPGVESAMFHQLIAGQRPSYQLQKHWLNAEGQQRWGCLTLAGIPGSAEEPTYAIAILEEITAQKQLKALQEEAIQRQEAIQQEQAAMKQLAATQQAETANSPPTADPTPINLAASIDQLGTILNTILSNSSDCFFLVDRHGKYIYVNQTGADTWGFSQKDFIGKTWQELKLSAEVMERLEAQRKTVFTIGQSVVDEITLMTVEGVRDFEYRMTRLGDENYQEPVIIVTFKDITEYKQAAAAESAALAKETELTALKSHVAHFTSIVTQELRNPLSNIFSYAKIIENNYEQGSHENQLSYLQRIQDNAKCMNQLLNDLLLIKKIQAKEVRLNPAELHLSQLCQEISAEVQETISSPHKITFISHNSCLGMWDEKLLRRTLTNLLLNAVHYSPEDSEIRVELICQDKKAIVHIQDAGIGIPEKDKKLLFNGFQPGESHTSDLMGTGLGLLVVKQCVDLQRGHIDVESQVGVGTRVTVILPYK